MPGLAVRQRRVDGDFRAGVAIQPEHEGAVRRDQHIVIQHVHVAARRHATDDQFALAEIARSFDITVTVGGQKERIVLLAIVAAVALTLRRKSRGSDMAAKPNEYHSISIKRITTGGNTPIGAISPDGKYLSGSLFEISGRQTLVEFPIDSLLKGVVPYETLLEFENDNSPYNFSYSQDGKYLYGSTYYTGVSNIVRYNRSLKQKEWISNCETGFFRPIPMGNDSVLVYRYTGKGFLPVIIADKPLDDVSAVRYLGRKIVEERPIVTTWAVKSPLTVNLDTLGVSSGEYNGLSHLRFMSAYPIVEGYKDHISFGMRTDITDPAFDHTVDASIS